MNIKDFLIDNYIWIIVIILITIITVIGFLADKKKGDKKKVDVPNLTSTPNNMAINNQQPIQYQQLNMPTNEQTNNNIGVNYNNPMPQMTNGLNQNVSTFNAPPIVTEPTPVPVNVVPNNNMNQMNNPMPIENVVPRIEQEPMYQPLSEQKPIIPPQPIPNFSEPLNNIQQPVINNSPLNVENAIPTPVPNTQINGNQQVQPTNEFMINQVPNYNNSNYTPPMGIENNNMVSAMNQMTTIPQPINSVPIPTPQQVQPQSIMPNGYNSQPMMPQQNYNQPVQQSHIEATVNQTSQPINFVYGPQGNNQNM